MLRHWVEVKMVITNEESFFAETRIKKEIWEKPVQRPPIFTAFYFVKLLK